MDPALFRLCTISLEDSAVSDRRDSQAERKKEMSASKEKRRAAGISLLQKLGPGLVTGASDDDPSGIATYSQVGARFGYGLLGPWS